MASYEMNEVMCALNLWYHQKCHSTSMQAPLDVVYNCVLAADAAHRILCKIIPFLCKTLA